MPPPGDERGTRAPEPPQPPAMPKRRRWRRVLLITVIVLAVLAGGGLVAGGLYLHSVDSSVKRVDAFTEIPARYRPQKVVTDAQNILILGSDTRDPQSVGGSRSDTIILAHLQKDHGGAQLISIPRDTWLHVPATADGRQGNQDAKINAAFAWGGIPLTVQTVETFTGVRVDHVVVVDFAGFKEIVDALGGVDLDVEHAFTSTHSLNSNGRRDFAQGWQHMDGAAALDYSRERYAFADGDFARIRHQQQVIRAILDKAAAGGLLTNPARLNAFLRATANAVSVDNTLSIFDTAMDLRHLRSGNLKFLTSPSKGTGTVGDQSVVLADPVKDHALFDAVRRDDTAGILATAN